MKTSRGLLTFFLFFLVSSIVVNAAPLHVDASRVKSMATPSPLPAGAHVVAGDPAKNEFFIIGGKVTAPVQVAQLKHHIMPIATQKTVKHIEVALQKKLLSPVNKQAGIKKTSTVAMTKPNSKHVASRTVTKTKKALAKTNVNSKVALSKTKHQVNTKVAIKVVAKGDSKVAVNKPKVMSAGSKRQVQVALLRDAPKHFINWRDHAKTTVVGKKLALLK